jgi:hypothetical protein
MPGLYDYGDEEEPPVVDSADGGTYTPPGGYPEQPPTDLRPGTDFEIPPSAPPPEDEGSWLDPFKDAWGDAMGDLGDWTSGIADEMGDVFGEGGVTGTAPGTMPEWESEADRREKERRTGDLPEQVGETWEDIFGEGADFGPTGEIMDEQRDEALRQAQEMMAARGMLGTGAAAALQTDIMRAAARDKAQAHQDWRQQQIQNKLSATSMMFQDSWHNLDHRQQESMAELMLEIERRRKYGEDYDPEMGDYEMQLLMDLASSDQLDPEGQALLRSMLSELFPENFKQGTPITNPDAWPPPGEGDSHVVYDDEGNRWRWGIPGDARGPTGEGQWMLDPE